MKSSRCIDIGSDAWQLHAWCAFAAFGVSGFEELGAGLRLVLKACDFRVFGVSGLGLGLRVWGLGLRRLVESCRKGSGAASAREPVEDVMSRTSPVRAGGGGGFYGYDEES